MSERPSSATVFVSSRCVNRCIFCSPADISEQHNSIPDAKIRDFIGRAAAMGARGIAFSGAGEPTLNPHLADYVHLARDAGFRSIAVQTNGYGLDRPLLRRLLDGGVTSFLVSVHGTREVHDRVVGRGGSFAEAMNALRLVLQAKLQVTVNTCVTRPSVPVLKEVVDLVGRQAPTRHVLAFPEWQGRARKNTQLLATYEQFHKAVATLVPSLHPGLELENVPDCMVPPGFKLSRFEGSIAYHDPVVESIIPRDLNLANNIYLPECSKKRCVHLGKCVGIDKSYLSHPNTSVTVRPVSGGGPRSARIAQAADRQGEGGQQMRKWVYRVAAEREPDPTWGRAILRADDVRSLLDGYRAYSSRKIEVLGFELSCLDGDLEALARLPGRQRLDIHLPEEQIFELYRFAPLTTDLRTRVLLSSSADLVRNLHVVASQRYPVVLWGDHAGFTSQQLVELTRYYLHERLLKVPIEPFHMILMTLMRGPGPSLWDVYNEQPETYVFVDDEDRATLSESWADRGKFYGSLDEGPEGWRNSTLFEWLAGYRGNLYEACSPCVTCPGFPGCAGFLVRHDQGADCSSWKAVFETIEEESRQIRHAVRQGREHEATEDRTEETE